MKLSDYFKIPTPALDTIEHIWWIWSEMDLRDRIVVVVASLIEITFIITFIWLVMGS